MNRNVLTIAKRELRSYFSSPVAFVFIVIFLLLSGYFTFMKAKLFQNGQASLQAFFPWHPWLYLFLVPAVGMGMWAEERRSGTIELLLTMPVAAWEAIVGKFFAAWTVVAVGLALTFPVVVTVNYLGTPDNGVILAGYIGSFLMAGAFLAVTAMVSAITRSQVACFIVSLVICLLLNLAGDPSFTDLFTSWNVPSLMDAVASISTLAHFNSIQKGVLDSRDLLYFVSVIVFSLFTTGVVIRAHRAG